MNRLRLIKNNYIDNSPPILKQIEKVEQNFDKEQLVLPKTLAEMVRWARIYEENA